MSSRVSLYLRITIIDYGDDVRWKAPVEKFIETKLKIFGQQAHREGSLESIVWSPTVGLHKPNWWSDKLIKSVESLVVRT